jgi:hypothetical protein
MYGSKWQTCPRLSGGYKDFSILVFLITIFSILRIY